MKKATSQDEMLKLYGLFSFARNYSLKGQLLLWIMPIIIMGLLSLSFAAYTSINTVIETELSNSMLMSVGKSAESINRWLATIMIEPETIASTPAAKRINQDFHNFDLQNINRHKVLHKNHPDIFQDIYAANHKGEYHTILHDGGKYTVFVGDIENRPYFRSIMAGGPTQITPPLISRTTGIPTIFMVAPILDNNNTPQGLIGAGISLMYIQQIAQELKAGKTGYGFIIAKDGTFIYHPNDDFIMQKKITEHENPSKKALGKLMVSGGSGIYRYSEGSERMVAFYQPIPITGWAVATVLPETELFAPAIKMMKLLVSVTILFAGLIAAAIFYTMQHLTQPLQRLALKTRQIATGDFTNGHLIVRSNDEIGSLSKSFNEMIDGLESQKAEMKNLVSKLQETVKELIKAKTYTTSIIDSMPSILICVDHHLNITQWNKAAEEATGVRADEVMGKSITKTLLRPGIDIEAISQSIENRKSKNLQRIARLSENDIFYDDITIFPLNIDDAKGAVIRIDDVTEKIKIEELLIQNEKMLSVGGLAAGMAHEINNPLGIILQTVQNVSRRLGTELAKNKTIASEIGIDLDLLQVYLHSRTIDTYLVTIKEAGERAAKIVRSMLDFSRKSESKKAMHSINTILDGAVDMASNDYDLKKKYDFKSVDVRCDYGDIPEIMCTETEIAQVFLNLIKNAAQEMFLHGYNGERPCITLKSRKRNDTITVCVEDNGQGMDAKSLKKIFEPFFTSKAPGEGTGLGLSVSYYIITTQHGGSIDVHSQLGQGTCFVIELPIHKGRKIES
jgi:PAS domain S-box-containing protein